ncbi:MAG: MTH938/NDUFAF3 family protein, partial [Gammaproteobacteria bacterium]
ISTTLLSAGIGFEVMDTAAACRSYVILLSEDRNVAAALLMIE